MKKLSIFLMLFLMPAIVIHGQDTQDDIQTTPYENVELDGKQSDGIQRVIELLTSKNVIEFLPTLETYKFVITNYTEHRRKGEKEQLLSNLAVKFPEHEARLSKNLSDIIVQAGNIDFQNGFQSFEMETKRNQNVIKGGNAILDFIDDGGRRKKLYVSGLYQLADGEWYILNEMKWLN